MRLRERLERLEAAHEGEAPPVIIWRDLHESDEMAVARHMAQRPEDEGRTPIVVGWGSA